jgi:hypothetical protein
MQADWSRLNDVLEALDERRFAGKAVLTIGGPDGDGRGA